MTKMLTAAEAQKKLGIRQASLYSYVSRGLIGSRPDPANPRARLYAAADVEALLDRRVRQRKPAAAAASALDRGLPVLETRLSRIEHGTLAYRGVDAVELAETATFEEVATLLWDASAPFDAGPLPRAAVPAALANPTDRAITALAAELPRDPPGSTGTRALERAAFLVRVLAAAAAGAKLGDGPMHRSLATAWQRPKAADAIRRALVLCADHELNASSFAVRVVASTGASMTACLIGGLAALSGPAHGGATERVAALFGEAAAAVSPAAAIAARLRRGDTIPGVGHPLYPDGDPRMAALFPHAAATRAVAALAEAIEKAMGEKPNSDFALVALERGHRLPPGAALALFAIGRSIGWVAHALEQRATGQLIRPRARFIG